MQNWNKKIQDQLNDLPGFPPVPTGSPKGTPATAYEWILGDWIDECRVRPGVDALVDLPATANTLGDVRFVVGLGAWYWWDGAAWAPVAGGGGGVATVTATAPISSSLGANPNISLTGIVPVANGGTGVSASGSVGNVLRSNGAVWTSSPLPTSVSSVSATGPLASSGGTTPDVSFPSWPTPDAPGVLTNDGTGTLSWGASIGSQDVIWYGVGRLSSASTLAGWQSADQKPGGSIDVVDNLPLYLKCHWRFTGTESLGDTPFEETKPPFANLAAFEAYVNGLRAAGIATGKNALFAQPFDIVDGNVLKLPDFVAKNNLWSMLFGPGDLSHKTWSPRYQNAVYASSDGGSRLDDTLKASYLGAVWNACGLGAPPSFADPGAYRCFWRAQPKRNLWVWSRQFKSSGRPQLLIDRRAYNVSTNTLVSGPPLPLFPEFEVDPDGGTAVLRVGEPWTTQWSTLSLRYYVSAQKSGNQADVTASSAVLCIPIRNVANPDEKAVYIKPLSQDTWVFRWFDTNTYDVEAVCYGGANTDNGYPVLRKLPPPGVQSAQQNVGLTSSLWTLNTLPVPRAQALRSRPGNRVRFRLRNKLTGRVGPFADSAMELRRDAQNPDLIRLLQASPR